MLWTILFVVALNFVSNAIADYGDLKTESGALEFDAERSDWIPICRDGFDDNAGDVACKQLGFEHSTGLNTYSASCSSGFCSTVCHIYCNGDEDKITDCDIDIYSCSCREVVGVECTAGWTVATIIVVVCVLLFLVALFACFICLIVFLIRRRARNSRIPYRVVTQRAPQVVHLRATTTIAATNNTTYDQAPPAYIPDSGYQPCPAGAPPPAEDPDH